MINLAMQEKLEKKEAFDVSGCKNDGVVYDLTGVLTVSEIYDGDLDFCDAKTEKWIWSIGVVEVDGKDRILAAVDSRFYGQRHDVEQCIWLR